MIRTTSCFLLVLVWFSGNDRLLGQVPEQVGDLDVSAVLQQLGARMEEGVSPGQLEDYAWHFRRLDRDGDGQHSPAEYIDNGNYLTPQSRWGIFRAADGDRDGAVTEAEYILNRIITDEAKAIMQRWDNNRNGSIEVSEFTGNGKLEPDVALAVFRALDADKNGSLAVPEYLRVWGQWARLGRPPAAERIHGSAVGAAEIRLVRWLHTFDLNQDGQLDKQEWRAWMRGADQDGDGKLNRRELERAIHSDQESGAKLPQPSTQSGGEKR